MKLVVLGVDWKMGSVELIERFSLVADKIPMFLRRFLDHEVIHEALVLSTCNRSEFYVVYSARLKEPFRFLKDRIEGTLASVKGHKPDGEEYLHTWKGPEAARHLFRVVCGLESMVLGEPQILGQTRDAYRAACQCHAQGLILHRVFHAALQVAKRARTETRIGMGAVSLGLAAVNVAQRVFSDLSRRRALVVGAGETACIVARNLKKRGIRELFVTNRTPERAQSLAGEYGAGTVPFNRIKKALEEVDIVVTVTASETPILSQALLEGVMRSHPGRPLCVVDLGVPRDVDPKSSEIPGLSLYDIDALRQVADGNLKRRQGEIPAVEKMIEEKVAVFSKWLSSLSIRPTLKAVVQEADAIRLKMLKRHQNRFPPELREELDRFTRSLVKRLLQKPLKNLKEFGAETEDGLRRIEAARDLFDLEEGPDA